jgi:hypothetical protein
MEATSNFSLRFAQASGSKAELPERLLRRQALERILTELSLISQGLAFSIFGILIIANRYQADLHHFADGSFVAMLGGTSALLVGTAFIIAAFLYWRCHARRSAGLAFSSKTACLTFARHESATAIASLA